MTLWQVLVTGESIEPLLDVLPTYDPSALAAFHGEALDVLDRLGRTTHGDVSATRTTAWADTARVLALASVVGMGPRAKAGREAVEKAHHEAFKRIQATATTASIERLGRAALGAPRSSVAHDEDVMVEGRRFRRVGSVRGGSPWPIRR